MIRDWVELNMTPGIGPRAAAKLLERFGSAESLYRATRTELEQLRLPPEAVDSIISRELLPRAEARLGCSACTSFVRATPPSQCSSAS